MLAMINREEGQQETASGAAVNCLLAATCMFVIKKKQMCLHLGLLKYL